MSLHVDCIANAVAIVVLICIGRLVDYTVGSCVISVQDAFCHDQTWQLHKNMHTLSKLRSCISVTCMQCVAPCLVGNSAGCLWQFWLPHS